jgi:hypothetical protein
MPNSDFLFIQVQQSGKVTPKRNVRTAIQKHVMRNIGLARRGQPRPKKQLENVAIENRRTYEAPSIRGFIPGTYLKKSLVQKEHKEAPILTQELDYTEPSVKVLCLASGGYRTDPFICWPISMNSETSFLVDYCECATSFCVYVQLIEYSRSNGLIRTTTTADQRDMAAHKSLRSCAFLRDIIPYIARLR